MRWFGRPERGIAAAGAIALLIGFATVTMHGRVRGLSWPYDADHFRDIAASQTLIDHGPFLDPYYADATWWYNPLMPAAAAAAAVVSGVDVPAVYAHGGTWLNLGAPVMFALLAWRLCGPYAAVAALIAYLFGTPRGTQAWHTATYSPWLFAGTFAQPLFYATLLALMRYWRVPGPWAALVVGLCLGGLILAHTGPSLIAVSVVSIGLLWASGRHMRRWPGVAADLGIVAATAGAIAALFFAPIALRYGFHIENRAPLEWNYELLEAARFADLLRTHATPATALAVVGLVAVIANRVPMAPDARRLVLLWASTNAALFATSYLRQLPALSWIPQLVPPFHFLSHLRALLALLAGVGLWALASAIWQKAGGKPAAATALRAVPVVVLIGVAAAGMRRFDRRDDFGAPVREAAERSADVTRINAYRWIRTHVPADAVVLASDDLGERVIGPAGRRVVSVGPTFSNPYEPFAPRVQARDARRARVFAGEGQAVCQQAAARGVTWIVWQGDVPVVVDAQPWLAIRHRTGDLSVAELLCPPRSTPTGS